MSYSLNEPVATLGQSTSVEPSPESRRRATFAPSSFAVPVIGVLSIQGDFEKHLAMLKNLDNIEAKRIRFPEEFDAVDALIIPGGESTTFTIHYDRWGYRAAIRDFVDSGKWIWGTCAGAIMLSKRVFDNDEQVDVEPLAYVDCDVLRNGWGRQVESFEAPVNIRLDEATAVQFTGVFIRAPRFANIGSRAKTIGFIGDEAVMIEQKNVIISSFHPELTDNPLIHEYFAGKVRNFLENLK